jgi:hypothetical protein
MRIIMTVWHNEWGRVVARAIYYALILAAIAAWYSRGNLALRDFVYQSF